MQLKIKRPPIVIFRFYLCQNHRQRHFMHVAHECESSLYIHMYAHIARRGGFRDLKAKKKQIKLYFFTLRLKYDKTFRYSYVYTYIQVTMLNTKT